MPAASVPFSDWPAFIVVLPVPYWGSFPPNDGDERLFLKSELTMEFPAIKITKGTISSFASLNSKMDQPNSSGLTGTDLGDVRNFAEKHRPNEAEAVSVFELSTLSDAVIE